MEKKAWRSSNKTSTNNTNSDRASNITRAILMIAITTTVIIAGFGFFFALRQIANRPNPNILDVSVFNSDIPLSAQLSTAQIKQAATNIQDTFFNHRDERGMYSHTLTCQSPDNCDVTEPNHRAGYGFLWGLNRKYAAEGDKTALYQLKTLIASYQGLIDNDGYAFQNDNFNCLILSDILQSNKDLAGQEKKTLIDLCITSVNEYYLSDIEYSNAHTDEQLIADTAAKLQNLLGQDNDYNWAADPFVAQLADDMFLRQAGYNYFVYIPDAIAKNEIAKRYALPEQAEAAKREILLNFSEMASLLYYYRAALTPADDPTVNLALTKAAAFYQDIGLDSSLIQQLSQQYQPTLSPADLDQAPARALAQTAFVLAHLDNSDPALFPALQTQMVDRFYYNQHGLIGFSDEFSADGWPRFEAYVNGLMVGLLP